LLRREIAMKNRTYLLIVGLACTIFDPFFLHAESAQSQSSSLNVGQHILDSNKGMSFEEIKGFYAEGFNKIDENNDAKISPEEYAKAAEWQKFLKDNPARAEHPETWNKIILDIVNYLDKNHDGFVTLDEYLDFTFRNVQVLDRDGDKFISIEEAREGRVVKKFYKDGGLKSESRYYVDGSTSRKVYFENGQLSSETYISSANASMRSKSYFENGQLASETNMDNRNQDVYEKGYSRNGTLLREYEIKHGKVIRDEFYCNEKMEQIFVRWIPGDKDLSVKKFLDLNLKDEEIALLKEAGITGDLEIRGSSGLGRECKASRAVFIMKKLIDSPIELKLPNETTIIYVQGDDGWEKIPGDAPTLDRTIRFKPDTNNPRYILHGSEGESRGGGHGGGISLGID
jgi:antitoxin component YwqK of YwqJK toxin-antitoxin module